MFNYIFNAIKVKLAVASSIRNLRNHDHVLSVITADDVTGTVGQKLEDCEGYIIESGKYSMGIVVDADKLTELALMAMLKLKGVSVRKVSFSFYKGVGNCYDGKPEGWVCTNI